LAQLLEHDHPDLVVSEMSKQARTGKVFVDWSQNDEHKTTIGVYSLRAREHPTASTPVTWEEVQRALKKKDADLLVFEAKQVVARFDKMGDLFAPVLELKQRLPDLKGVAASAATEEAAPISMARANVFRFLFRLSGHRDWRRLFCSCRGRNSLEIGQPLLQFEHWSEQVSHLVKACNDLLRFE